MARRKRRDEDAVDERLDQETDETLDEAAEDVDALDDDDLDDVDDELESADDEDTEERPARRGGALTKRARADADTKAKTKPPKAKPEEKKAARRGPIAFLIRFIREVVAELRKVIWPTRKELLTYTGVVVVFVVVMLGIIALFDYGFARGLLFLFGSTTVEQ